MTARGDGLKGARVLVLEDDYYLATDLQSVLEAAGAMVVGPFGDEADAMRGLAGAMPDCGFIDVNLGRGPSFGVPHALARASVPFVFVTGYDADIIPDEFADVRRFEKPFDPKRVVETAIRLLRPG